MTEAAAPVKLIEPSAMEGFFVSAAPRRPHHTRQSPEVLHSLGGESVPRPDLIAGNAAWRPSRGCQEPMAPIRWKA